MKVGREVEKTTIDGTYWFWWLYTLWLWWWSVLVHGQSYPGGIQGYHMDSTCHDTCHCVMNSWHGRHVWCIFFPYSFWEINCFFKTVFLKKVLTHYVFFSLRPTIEISPLKSWRLRITFNVTLYNTWFFFSFSGVMVTCEPCQGYGTVKQRDNPPQNENFIQKKVNWLTYKRFEETKRIKNKIFVHVKQEFEFTEKQKVPFE